MRQYTSSMRQLRNALVALVMIAFAATTALAQTDGTLHINIIPKAEILPPQVGQYKDNLGKLFMVTMTNTGNEEQYVYFGLQLEYIQDAQGISIGNLQVSTPVDRPISQPYVITPGSNALSEIDLRRIFNHIPTSALKFDADIIGVVGTSDFGLLPEGRYRARLTAYKWDVNLIDVNTKRITNPIPLTDPTTDGVCEFQVCYRAQAPQLEVPNMAMGTAEAMGVQVLKLPADNPVFAWTEPVINCAPLQRWRYELIIKEVLDNGNTLTMTPQEAIDAPGHPYVLRASALTQPQSMVDYNALKRLKEGKVYVAQVTATPAGGVLQATDFNYTMIENKGKSNFIAFTLDKSNGFIAPPDTGDDDDDGGEPVVEPGDDDDEEEGDEDEEDDDLDLELIGVQYEIGDDDAKYVFRTPHIVKPDFSGESNHAVFAGNDVESKWEAPIFVGGAGQQPDTLKFRYRAQIYTLSGYANAAEAMEQPPFYDSYVKGPRPENVDEAKPLPKVGELPEDDKETAVGVMEDYILWKALDGHVSVGDVLLLRILPECINEESVRFFDDDASTIAFTYTDKLSDAFGNACGEGSIQENRKPIDISDADMKGKTVHVGEYDMEIKDAKQDKQKHSWSGTGWMNWYPFGKDIQKVKIGVKFEDIFINSDFIMYDGVVKNEQTSNWEHLKNRAMAYSDPTNTDDLIPDDIFSEWGIDNLIGAATPEILDSYVDKDAVEGEVNNLAKKVKASKYYDWAMRGYTVYEKLLNEDLSFPEIEVFLPLQVPESWNPSPVDIQVLSCEFYPTRAFMNLMGMTKLPDNEITDENILMFGAPRICMDPEQLLPGSGNIILMENLTVNDPKSDFSIKFKAPKNKEKPEDGCMISWANNKFSTLSIDCEIAVPDLIKCDENGKVLEGQVPKMQITGKVSDWEDWYASVSMDPFTHEDLPGWTFTAKDVTLDLSSKQNNEAMKFPTNFDKKHFLTPETKTGDKAWKGLYIGDLAVQFPEGFIKNGDQRFKIDGSEMIIDRSGVTCSLGLKDPVDASIDDWALKIEKVAINILQNDFNGCGMSGSIHVPLTHKEDYIAFSCDMIPQKKSLKKPVSESGASEASESDKKGGFDFLLKIQPTENGENDLDGKLNFDFFLASLKLSNKQTYFLLEAIDQGAGQGYDTKVELCMAGEINVGGDSINKHAQEYLNQLPFKVSLPGIHFTQMRLSNRKRDVEWVHGEAVRKAAIEDYEAHKGDKKFSIPLATENKTFEFGTADSPCYLDCGNWSVASFDKKIGPFAFGIDDYDFGKAEGSDSVYIEVKGRIGLVMDGNNPLISATTTLRFNALVNIKEKEFSYAGCDFRGCSLDIKTMGMGLYGELNVNDGTTGDAKNGITDKGYDGKLKFTMPGDFFSIEAEGGYYDHKADDNVTGDENFSWGYFRAEMASKAGIHVDPVVINRIMGGFYFNCQPTKGTDEKKDPFGGKPKGKKGPIGIALGLGLSTSAGEETLKADVDLLVVYDRKSHRLSTFMMNGELNALSDMVKAKVSIIYEHTVMNKEAEEQEAKGAIETKDAVKEVTKDKYLALNITVDAGADTKSLMEKVTSAKGKLADIKKSMDDFQENLDKIDITKLTTDQTTSLSNISGDPDKPEGQDDKVKKKKDEDNGISAGKTHVALEFKITWYKDGEKKDKWHLYVGEPAKDKRCYFTYLKFKSKICSVDIGADAYLCLGNELPDNGALPAIPDKISKFLEGEKKEGVDMGADLAKVEKSRAKATRELLKQGNLKGGVMVGASCWGEISVDLGLIYGGIEALAGFDLSLANYGAGAVCVNSGSSMGYNGWYAMGQLYAYLGANLGIQIKIGKLINEKVSLINAGIGGVLEMGLPNPTWVEGKLRVKMSFLDGLFKVDKKFSFSAGDHCVPFAGNALAGFEMFQDVSLGSDSLYEALCNPEKAISRSDANRMIFTTNTSIGSHYRLVDPSYQAYTGNDSLLSIHNSRTYVFDVEKVPEDENEKGVVLFDLGTYPTQLVNGSRIPTETEFKKKMQGYKDPNYTSRNSLQAILANYFYDRENTVAETSTVMKDKDLNSSEVRKLEETSAGAYMDEILKYYKKNQVNVSFREDKGTSFHLTGMNLQPGHSYMLVLRGSAYEILNGRRQWVDYYDENNNNKKVHLKWKQSRLWFFRVKSDAEDIVVGDSLRDLTPYVALAYPSVDGTNVQSKGVTTTAYMDDILHPTIALNRDIRNELPESTLKWRLRYFEADNLDKPIKTTYKKAIYKPGSTGNCINIEPESVFEKEDRFVKAHNTSGKDYGFNDEVYNLQLRHTFKYNGKDSTVALVDLWLNPAPYDVVIKGTKYSDNWMQTTARDVTGSLLPYSEPFVGARPWESPTIEYETKYRSTLASRVNDDETFINNADKYEGIPYRLVDPYLYLAYLSKWTFIGDRAINAYAFDDVETPLGSESLIFQKGSTVMNTEFLKNDKNVKSLYQVRNDFYSMWNDWSYNNTDLPKYPLPITLGSVGGPTLNNQDDRVSSITPINLNYGESRTYKLTNLVKDFSDPYIVASLMSQKLRREAQNLFGIFTLYLKKDESGKITGLNNSGFNYYMKMNSDLHRGQYIEVKSGDVSAKVPYYQLPLIFGDCFGGDAKYKGVGLDNDGRTFSKSIGKSDITDTENRWPSEASNLLFFRLLGNEKYTTCEPESFLRWKTKWSESYLYDNSSAGRLQVAWDFYDANEGLKAVTDFKARIYRVDAYDISTGLYTLSNPSNKNSGMGAGPWFETISINSTNADVKNLGEMTEGIAANEQYASTHYEHPVLQALYTPFNQRLTLVYSDSVYVSGNKLGGNTIGEVWADSEFDSKMKYAVKVKKQLKSVQIDSSVANAEIQSTAKWFQQCENLEQIIGLRYLNTSKVKDMMAMFDTCPKLTSIDISMFDMSNVEIIHSLFYGCTALTSVKMNLDMPKLKDVTDLFAGCTSLETIDIRTLKGTDVRNLTYMFSTCTSLKTLRIDKFAPKEVDNSYGVFYNVGNKSKGLTIYYSYYLPVKSQLPSWATLIELGNPAKAMHLQNSKGEQILLFINSDDEYAKNTTVSIKGESKTYSNMTVKNVWAADNVLNTGNTPGWNSIKSNLVKIIIDPSFSDAPKSVKNWFSNCPNLTAIEGLKNLNITYGTTLEGMFMGCTKLQTIDVSGLDFSCVESAANMFSGCTSLTTIKGLSGIELPKDISGMFKNCQKLQLDVNSLIFKYVENVKELFYGCTWLTSLNLNLVLTDIKNVAGMFRGCSNLEEAKLTLRSDLTDISNLFEGCAKLKEIDFSRLHTDDVTGMTATFSGCSSLQKLWLNQLSAERCADNKMSKMFYNVPKDCHIYMLKSTYDDHQGIKTQLPTAQYVNLHLITDDAIALTLKKADKDYKLVFLKKQSNVSYDGDNAKYKGMEVVSVRVSTEFIYNTYLYASPTCCEDYITEVEFDPSFAEVRPTTTQKWLANMPNLTTISGLQYLNTSETTDMGAMFSGCTSLTSVSGLNISESVTNLSMLFYNCKKLKTINFGTVNTSKVTDMSSMFYGCQALEELSLEKFSSASVRNMQRTFDACTNLRTLKLGSSFTAAQVEIPDPKNTFRSVHDMLVDLPDASIAAVRTSFVDKLGFVDGKTGWIGRASLEEAMKTPQVIWTADNATLTFYYGVQREVGDNFGMKKITKVWSGDDVANTPENNAAPWTSTLLMAGTDVKVVIDESFAQARPKSTNYWFALYKMESIEGFQNLNTSSVTNMNGMFKGSNVKELNFSNINFSSVVKANELFADCKELHTLMDLRYSARFITTAENVFRNVSDVDVVLNQQWMMDNIKPNWESKVGWIEGTHGRFLTLNNKKVMQAIWTENNNTMTFVYKAPYNAGDKFNGQTITNVWKDSDFSLVESTSSSQTQLLNGEWTTFQYYYKKWTATVKDKLTKVVFDRSFVDVRPTNMKAWFTNCVNLTTIEGWDNLNTDEVTDMSWLFFRCTKMTSIDMSRFNTSKVTSMVSMFSYCSALTSLDLSSFNTENVTDMNNMFRECKSLTTITGNQVSFKKVTNMAYMFYNCPKLNLNMSLSGLMLFETSNVVNMAWMFAGNEGSTIYIAGLQTGNVKNMKGMFYGCKNITKLTYSSAVNYWKTDNVTDMSYMFAGCTKLNLNDVSAWSKYNTAKVTTMKAMFKGCSAMTYLKLSTFNTAKVKNMESMFSGCTKLKTLIVGSGFSVASLSGSQSDVFKSVTGLTIKMPSSVYENRSSIFTTKLGFKSTNGNMIEN